MIRIIILCLGLLCLSGCTDKNDSIFREKIVPDMEQVISANSSAFEAYEEALAAAEVLASDPTEENKQRFLEAAEASKLAGEQSADVSSKIGESEYKAMEALGLSRGDYEYLFESQAASMITLTDWFNLTEFVENNFEADGFAHLTASQELRLELERVYLAYGSMDWIAYADENNAQCFKEMLYRYPNIFPEDFEWITDHDMIVDEANSRMDEIEAFINSEQEYINKSNNELRLEQAQ